MKNFPRAFVFACMLAIFGYIVLLAYNKVSQVYIEIFEPSMLDIYKSKMDTVQSTNNEFFEMRKLICVDK